MTFLPVYLQSGLAILVLMTALWIASLPLRNSSIVDIFWGTGFAVVAWVAFALTPDGFPARKALVAGLVTLWGLRLSLHIFLRNRGKGEDFRYRAWREQAGPSWWWRSLLRVFVLQGILMWVIAAPVVAAQVHPLPARLSALDLLAVLVWLVGFIFEAVGDLQLTRFKADPAHRGKLMTSGLWRYTRHPNYFGDAVQWWGYFLIAAATPGGLWTVFSPLIMTALLLRVSGVALLEKTLKETKPGYQAYMQATSAFVPWFPRKTGG